mmetsp:Transcript_19257/g.31161  ORF Transcript_19257/g.31161 Transcript_19257/m.31161 type:complete len:131 (-) Transcript_19257:30-422(-)
MQRNNTSWGTGGTTCPFVFKRKSAVARVRGYGEAPAKLLEERTSREAFEAELKARTTEHIGRLCEEERERRNIVERERDMLRSERDELELKCKAKDRKIAALQEKLAVAQATADVVVLGDSDSSGDDEVA